MPESSFPAQWTNWPETLSPDWSGMQRERGPRSIGAPNCSSAINGINGTVGRRQVNEAFIRPTQAYTEVKIDV
ncbi:hypothetical protein CC2G_014160 [Coprinopsis cinerea AmutBmut pab1-1]|nr:hypothetical protein CC2G_014160 [Coprinopsis cinerea AmutBmut pab1-1]